MITWEQESGRLTLDPASGRMLQVEVRGQPAFWQNPAADPGWNRGGDRIWISPELDWNWKSRERVDFTQYEVQPGMDPGTWRTLRSGTASIDLEQAGRVYRQTDRQEVNYRLIRSFTLLPDRCHSSQIAYRTDTELLLLDGPEGQRIGLWSLLQIPAAGELSIARTSAHAPGYRDYFSPMPESHLTGSDTAWKIRITGDRQFKIGFLPDACAGQLSYTRPVQSGQSITIQRHFDVSSWQPYIDVPLDNPDSAGDCVQVYNDGGDFGGFGEMEYHSPALTFGFGPQRMIDTSLTVVRLDGEGA